MTTIHIQDAVAERLAKSAEAQGLSLDAYLERIALPNPTKVVTLDNGDGQLAAVLAITKRLFPDGASVTESFDPAWPDDKFFVVNVVATGDPDSIIQRQSEWHTELAKILPDNADGFQLSIDVPE